jgi:RNA polymerase sigma factor (sigma-70 family)
MDEILHIKTQLTTLSDEKLLEGLKSTLEDKESTQLQFEFYNRFSGYIYKVALQKFRNFREPKFLAEEVLQTTFITAFQKIGKFNLPMKSLPKEHGTIIKAWLGKIAINESKKAIGKIIDDKIEYDTLKLPDPEYDQFENIYGEPVAEVPNEFRQKLQGAMNLLSEKEKHIILTYADEGCIETNRKQHISDSSLQYLCEYYQTTTDAIKQCKKRALDKIKKYCFE